MDILLFQDMSIYIDGSVFQKSSEKDDYKVALLSLFYLTVTETPMSSLISIGLFYVMKRAQTELSSTILYKVSKCTDIKWL